MAEAAGRGGAAAGGRREPSPQDAGREGAAAADMPRDAKLIIELLKSMGVADFAPQVVGQFLELVYHYVTDVLGDARAYSEHAGKAAIDTDDAKLAIHSRALSSFAQPPPVELLVELAEARNRLPLPSILGRPGIALPPEADTLVTPNYQVAAPRRPHPPGVGGEKDAEPREPGPPASPATTPVKSPSFDASRASPVQSPTAGPRGSLPKAPFQAFSLAAKRQKL